MMRLIFNEIIKRKEFTLEDWKEVTIKSDTQERRRGKCE